jgi:hypothetical protein
VNETLQLTIAYDPDEDGWIVARVVELTLFS